MHNSSNSPIPALLIVATIIALVGIIQGLTAHAQSVSQSAPLPPDSGVVVSATSTDTSLPAQTNVQAAATAEVPAQVVPTPAPIPSANIAPEQTLNSQPERPATEPLYPVRVSAPAIGLNSPVIKVGVTSNGEMDVPSGATKNVGWYEYGTVPGAQGSAVLDAHVFAAFSKLHDLKAGDDIFVTMSDGSQRHFKVQEMDTYALQNIPLQTLFNRADQPRLNLITCAGKLTADRSTYDHRLVVYATLVQ